MSKFYYIKCDAQEAQKIMSNGYLVASVQDVEPSKMIRAFPCKIGRSFQSYFPNCKIDYWTAEDLARYHVSTFAELVNNHYKTGVQPTFYYLGDEQELNRVLGDGLSVTNNSLNNPNIQGWHSTH